MKREIGVVVRFMTVFLLIAVILPIPAKAADVSSWSTVTDFATYFSSVTYVNADNKGSVTLNTGSTGFTITANSKGTIIKSATKTILTIKVKKAVKIEFETTNSNIVSSITSGSTVNADSTITFELEGKNVSGDVTISLSDGDTGPEGCAMYSVVGVGTTPYLNKAIEMAGTNGTIVVMAPGGKVFHSDGVTTTFTIPSGVKLVVPYNIDDTGNFDDTPASSTAGTGPSNQSAYATLTLTENTVITCYGSINVNGETLESTSENSAVPCGKYGLINLSAESAKIILASKNTNDSVTTNDTSGTMYCYGYIVGSGIVEAQNGASVYELFQAIGWRGGSTMADWITNDTDTFRNFPLSEYYMQNIESNLEFRYGAVEKAVVSFAPTGVGLIQYTMDVIGTSAGLLQLSEGSSVHRHYDAVDDRVTYTFYGGVTVGGIRIQMEIPSSAAIIAGILGLKDIDIQSSNYILGINGAMEFVVAKDAEVTLAHDYKIMPGAKITVNEGGKAIVNGDLYIYDVNDWMNPDLPAQQVEWGVAPDNYLYYNSRPKHCIPVLYSATTGKASSRTVNANTPAELIINGELEVNGGLWTTSNGGNSSNKVVKGAGKLINNSTTATTVVTDEFDEILHIYDSEYKSHTGSKEWYAVDVDITVIPAVGLIAGLSTSNDDYRCFETGKTYYGTASGYWYEYVVTAEDDAKAGCVEGETVASTSAITGTNYTVGIVGNGSTITFDATTNKATGLTAANGTFTFNVTPPNGYTLDGVTASNGTVSGTGPYTLTEVTADTTLVLTLTEVATGEVIHVTITWGSMNFTYTKGAWDPETHTYGVGTIAPESVGANVITITNGAETNIDLTASISYTPADGYTGKVTGSLDKTSIDLLAAAQEKSHKVTLTLFPNDAHPTSTTVGKVTVTISKKGGS